MSMMAEPSGEGRFGDFGGRFLPESLVPACAELEAAFRRRGPTPPSTTELDDLLRDYGGRPTPSPSATGSSERLGVRVLLKREDLTHTGSHKINNVIGQALLTRRMGKRRMIAETGAGQHGVATATAAALFGFECRVYMGEVDVERQALNVFRMKLLGAEVDPGLLRQPHPEGRHQRDPPGLGGHRGDHPLLPRLGDGPAPVPVDGAGVPADRRRGGAPSSAGRCSTAPIPTWSWPAWAAGPTPPAPSPASSTPTPGWSASSPRAAPPSAGASPAWCTACKSFLLQDEHGQVLEAHSISAGLDYPGVGPEHAHLSAIGRARYVSAGDAEVLARLPPAGRDRGHHPRPRAGPRPGLGGPGRRHRRAPAGLHRARHPLGPGRQGRGPGHGDAR